MTLPRELDVPHWARAMVDNYRRAVSLPPHITDRMIYARLEDCHGMEQEDTELSVRDLLDEVPTS